MNRSSFLAACCVVWLMAPVALAEPDSWREVLSQRLPEFGHRNWIVIADSAYPKQSAPGIETVYTGEDHLTVLEEVLRAVADARHVQPVVMLDEELSAIAEENAPGADEYRAELRRIMGKAPTRKVPHEEIIVELDKGAKLFNVLVLKTNLNLPYTSVFLQLDCGYWSPEKEKLLRQSIARKKVRSGELQAPTSD